MNQIITVTDLNYFIKDCLDNIPFLQRLNVKGELSNVKLYQSGHLYFTLKDSNSVISCVMFSFDNSMLDFMPKDGDEVIITGSVKIYPSQGKYQLYVSKMILSGKGDALLALEELKRKLQLEGLFDSSRKRPINQYPKNIGVIAGNDSAAYHDIVKNIHRRYPIAKIYFFPSLVQGEAAPKDLLRAFNLSQEYDLDTLIISRGGGSGEDLNAFNDETLVRAVATSKMPVIAAIGHEIDFTLIDFVADKRVSTPTAAAELSTKNKDDLYDKFNQTKDEMIDNILKRINGYKEKLNLLSNRSIFINPKNIYQEKIKNINNIKQRLELGINNYLKDKTKQIESIKQYLYAISPNTILDKGFALVYDEEGRLVKDITKLKNNEIIKTKLKDGIIKSQIYEISKENK